MSSTDLWMELADRDMLARFMAARDMSIRGLAAATKVTCRQTGERKSLSHAKIGRLHSGASRTCNLETATAIEKALNVPPLVLFHPRVLRRQVSSAA